MCVCVGLKSLPSWDAEKVQVSLHSFWMIEIPPGPKPSCEDLPPSTPPRAAVALDGPRAVRAPRWPPRPALGPATWQCTELVLVNSYMAKTEM